MLRVFRGLQAAIVVVTTLLAIVLPNISRAASPVIFANPVQGRTPFIATVLVTGSGLAGSYSAITFTITPKLGSYTNPIYVFYNSSYLSKIGAVNGNTVNIPIFGLYAGYNNSFSITIQWNDGTRTTDEASLVTTSYTDPCGAINAPIFQQHRTATSQLAFDYFLLKDSCSSNSPAIVDTDSNIRWVGTAGVATLSSTVNYTATNIAGSILYTNPTVYASDGSTGINRIDIPTGLSTKVGDYSSIGVTFTGHHNIDPGKTGMIVDVNTTTETEAVDLEIDRSGNVLNEWDLGYIISAAMRAGGDNPAQFVYPVGNDWFHNNSTTYNPVDNTLVVSSRENFVIAVDYDPPPQGGVRKIHWILGDTTKKWYTFPSLRAFALKLGPNTYPPIGQHGIWFDPTDSSIAMLDDGLGSQFQKPPGITRMSTIYRSYQIDTAHMTATGYNRYAPQPTIYSAVCGSGYSVQSDGSSLVDFAYASAGTRVDLQGLGYQNQLVFDLQYSSQTCTSGWNALPLTGGFTFF